MDHFQMEPPPYDVASGFPPPHETVESDFSPPPAYNTSSPCPSTPPPSYVDATQHDPFPVLTPPFVPTVVTQPPHSSEVIVHSLTQVGSRSGRTQTLAVVSQPQGVPIQVQCLREIPGYVRCTQCQRLVTTKIKHVPGSAAWCPCVLLALMGLICGFCLIPLFMTRLQDVHHSCPQCEEKLYIYKR